MACAARCRPEDGSSSPPGESITLPPRLAHQFQAVGGTVLAGEVSSLNDDETDNYFIEPVSRFPSVEEDAPPLYPLCTEYPSRGVVRRGLLVEEPAGEAPEQQQGRARRETRERQHAHHVAPPGPTTGGRPDGTVGMAPSLVAIAAKTEDAPRRTRQQPTHGFPGVSPAAH